MHSRLHFHVVLNRRGNDDLETVKSLWEYGLVELTHLDGNGDFTALAKYLTKESRQNKTPNGKRWVGSINFEKPTPVQSVVSDNEDIIVPRGAVMIAQVENINEFGHFKYIKYVLPKKRQKKKLII